MFRFRQFVSIYLASHCGLSEQVFYRWRPCSKHFTTSLIVVFCSDLHACNLSGYRTGCVALSITLVSLKIQPLSWLLFAIFGLGSLGRIQDIGTTFFAGFFDTFDVVLDMLLQESKGRGSLRQNLKESRR